MAKRRRRKVNWKLLKESIKAGVGYIPRELPKRIFD